MDFNVRRRNRRTRGSGCVAVIVGLMFMAVAFYLIKDTLSFIPGTLTAQGTIIKCSYDTNSDDGGGSCNPTTRFVTQAGQTITIGSSESASSFHQGDKVSVKYHAKTPQDGRIYSFVATWMIPLLCGVLGLIAFFLGLIGGLVRIARRMMGFY